MKSKVFQALIFLLLSHLANSQVRNADIIPPNRPVQIDAAIELYKVYDINTVDETYKVDGYFSYFWKDERMAFDTSLITAKEIIYTNDRVDNLIENDLWFPEMEFINTLGARELDNKAISIDYMGNISYTERFQATFKEELEYRRFPFDRQTLKIEIEPFIHDVHHVVIRSLDFTPAMGGTKIETDNWTILNTYTEKSSIKSYVEKRDTIGLHLNHDEHSLHELVQKYSHVECVLDVKRMPGYFLWQLMFPLGIIIAASVVILWIEDFSTQLDIGFTLMLTVVAFNFFAETLLPQLPYNTYIEVLIMLGYIFILLCIFMVVYMNTLRQLNAQRADRLIGILRIVYPISLVLAMLITTWIYFGSYVFKLFSNQAI